MIDFARQNDGLVRKNPIDSIHPIVRVHPVTGERAIYLNAEFVTGMPGLKEKEYELIRDFLIGHIQAGHDFQCRVQWERHSVVMFDGRNTLRKFGFLFCPQQLRLASEWQLLTVMTFQIRRRLIMIVASKRDISFAWHL